MSPGEEIIKLQRGREKRAVESSLAEVDDKQSKDQFQCAWYTLQKQSYKQSEWHSCCHNEEGSATR